jgi:hypothetical protein
MNCAHLTVGDHFGDTLARRGLSVTTQNNWDQGGDVLVIETGAAMVLRIADEDGWTHQSPSAWPGGRAIVCPADEDGGTILTGEVLYQSPGPGDFEADAARLVSAVLEYLRQNGQLPPQELGEVDEALALAHLALADAGWTPSSWDDPEDWRNELRAGHAAYLEGKAVAVGVDELGTITRAAESGCFDSSRYEDLREALAAVRHGGMASWKRTPYGCVWVDEAK